MHSRKKVKKRYPSVNETMIRKLYGFGIDNAKSLNWRYKGNGKLKQQLAEDGEIWKEFNKINLTEFMQSTNPTLAIWPEL
mgnify:CR=1 FL=1